MQLVTRMAIDRALRVHSRGGPIPDHEFAFLWHNIITQQPHALRSQSWLWQRLHGIQCWYVHQSTSRRQQHLPMVDSTRSSTSSPPAFTNPPQKLLLSWMRRVDCLMPLTHPAVQSHGTHQTEYVEVRTYSHWVARVEEISRLVQSRVPPSRAVEADH